MKMILRLMALLLGFTLINSWADDDFLPLEKAFKYEILSHENEVVTIKWHAAPRYYLYKKKLQATAIDGEILQVTLPTGIKIEDEFFGISEIYRGDIEMRVNVGAATKLQLSWQGCADAGLCYPPQRAIVDLQQSSNNAHKQIFNDKFSLAHSKNIATSAAATPQETPVFNENNIAEDQQLAQRLAQQNKLVSIALFFTLGLLLALTPCVLPMVPILSVLIFGSKATRKQSLLLSLIFVLTMALTYALVGVLVALLGAQVQAALQTKLFIVPLVVIFVALALAMFDVYELQLPKFARDFLGKQRAKQISGSLLGAAIMGFLSSLLVSPCMSAPLAGILIFIADSANLWFGALALFVLALGMGVPLIAIAVIGTSFLPQPGMWMQQVKTLFGIILLIMAIWFLDRVVSANITLMLSATLLIALACGLQSFGAQPKKLIIIIAKKTIACLFMLYGCVLFVGAIGGAQEILQPLAPFNAIKDVALTQKIGQHNARFQTINSLEQLERELEQATAQQRWTLLDFYADWCVSCKEIERDVFNDPQVASSLANINLLRVDITFSDALNSQLLQNLKVVGPPSILFFTPDGREKRSARIVGEIAKEEFLQHLAAFDLNE